MGVGLALGGPGLDVAGAAMRSPAGGGCVPVAGAADVFNTAEGGSEDAIPLCSTVGCIIILLDTDTGCPDTTGCCCGMADVATM